MRLLTFLRPLTRADMDGHIPVPDDWSDIPEFNPQPVELDLEETRVRAEVLCTAIQNDNAEIARLTGLRDQHLVMLAGEEAKAKVLAAFAERTIEAGKTQIAAE